MLRRLINSFFRLVEQQDEFWCYHSRWYSEIDRQRNVQPPLYG